MPTPVRSDRAVAPLGYRPALDGLRGLAVLMVVATHTGVSIFAGGEDGVVVFFVLSGFLITTLLLQEIDRHGSVRIKSFYARRFVRLVPAVVVMVLALAILTRLLVPRNERLRPDEALYAIFYVTNLKIALFGAYDHARVLYLQHTWSLAIEEHFYLFWPWLVPLFCAPNWSDSRRIRTFLWAAAIIAALRVFVDVVGADDLMMFSPLRFDGFAIGGALAVAFRARGSLARVDRMMSDLRMGVIALALLLCDVAVGARSHEVPGALYVTWVCVISAVLIGHFVWSEGSVLTRLFGRPFPVYLGKLSYSLYLWHIPVFVYITEKRFSGTSRVLLHAIELAVTFAMAAGSYHLVECRFTRVRQRLRVA